MLLCASEQAKAKGWESIWINLLLLSVVRKVKTFRKLLVLELEKRKDMRTNTKNRRREEEMRGREVDEKYL